MTNANAEARAQYIRILVDKVRNDLYPSTTQLDMIEEVLPKQWIPEYLQVLFEKIEDDPNPSIPMLRRIARLVQAAR
jgi:hypothetical protein